jgi:hypothetical protein
VCVCVCVFEKQEARLWASIDYLNADFKNAG